MLNQDLRVVTASRSFYEVFQVKPKETVGELIYDLGNKQWDIPKLRELLETILPQMGMDAAATELIQFAAPMHDLGKIGIPDKILLKPSRLSPLEWEIMKKHTLIGAEIMKDSDIELLQIGEVIALTHHEKWDGSGYPAGLKGEEIPLSGRIVAIVDVFDALCSVRPYKDAYSLEESLVIIHNGSGNHFDPAVVDAFFEILDEIRTIKLHYESSAQQINEMGEFKSLLSQYRENFAPPKAF